MLCRISWWRFRRNKNEFRLNSDSRHAIVASVWCSDRHFSICAVLELLSCLISAELSCVWCRLMLILLMVYLSAVHALKRVASVAWWLTLQQTVGQWHVYTSIAHAIMFVDCGILLCFVCHSQYIPLQWIVTVISCLCSSYSMCLLPVFSLCWSHGD